MAGGPIVPVVVKGGRLEMGRGGMLRVDAQVKAQAALLHLRAKEWGRNFADHVGTVPVNMKVKHTGGKHFQPS